MKGLAKGKPTFELHCVGKEAIKEAIPAQAFDCLGPDLQYSEVDGPKRSSHCVF